MTIDEQPTAMLPTTPPTTSRWIKKSLSLTQFREYLKKHRQMTTSTSKEANEYLESPIPMREYDLPGPDAWRIPYNTFGYRYGDDNDHTFYHP